MSARATHARAEPPSAAPPPATPRDVDAAGTEDAPDAAPPAAVRRMRLLAVSVLLVGWAFVQAPGSIVADTKLDLAVAPARFLARATHLWDPQGFFGQLQNQAYGYLFPMGPFFLVGDLLGLPAWVTQRLWWSTLLVGAFLGAYLLASTLRVGTPSTRLLAAVAYAVSPRVLSGIGSISAEIWPMAVAPWVLVPLVRFWARGGSPRRAAALSGVAVAAAGGVNAVAVGATLVLPAWWLVTRPAGPARRSLAAWWALAVGCATAWWAVPLMLLGRYSPPFLDWIEDAAVSTAHTSALQTLSGTSHWLGYLAVPGTGPSWPTGFALVTSAVVVLDVAVLAGLGLAGLLSRSRPEPTFLLGGVLIGLLLVGLGYSGAVDGVAAAARQDLLDGVLAPLRNTHKFDLVLRLPLAVGLAHALARLRLPGLAASSSRRIVALVAGTAVATTAGVAAVTGLAPPGPFAAIPAHWVQTAQWLAQHGTDGRALVVPAASSGTYTWGRPRDEPLQPLARTAWAVRDAVPLSSAGNIRVLDAVERRLESGRGSPGLAAYLARAGIGHLVVRNDLVRYADSAPRPVQVRSTLAGSPGLVRVAAFGPLQGGGSTESTAVDSRLDVPLPAVEIWRVTGAARHGSRLVAADDVPVLTGGPEGLLDLDDAGAGPPAALLAGDSTLAAGGPATAAVLTDSLRRREISYGAVRDNTSATLTAEEPLLLDRVARDYLVPGTEGHESTARLLGVAAVRASSSGSDVTAVRSRGPQHQPWSALDGDPRTSWRTGSRGDAVGQWWETTFTAARSVDGLRVSVVDDPAVGPPPWLLEVRADTGTARTRLTGTTDQPLRVPDGPTRTLRITVLETRGPAPPAGAGLTEVLVPGLAASRPVVLAPAPQLPVQGLVLTAAVGASDECVWPAGRRLCVPTLARVGEEQGGIDRSVQLPRAVAGEARVTVRPRPGPQLEQLLAPTDGRIVATASSRALQSPSGRPDAAVDRDLTTGWIAAPDDRQPVLGLSWDRPRRVTGLQVLVDGYLAAARPTQVAVDAGRGEHVVAVDETGYARFPATTTTSVTIRVLAAEPVRSVNPISGLSRQLPPGVSELRVLGADDLRREVAEGATTGAACGFGPTLVVAGRTVDTRVVTTVGDVLRGATAMAEPCPAGSTRLPPGHHRISVRPSAEFDVEQVSLAPAPSADQGSVADAPAPAPLRWTATQRSVPVEDRAAGTWLVLDENHNAGWQATLHGRPLVPARLDGWRQAFLLPAGAAGTVEIEFAPDRTYRAALAVGLALVLALVPLAAAPGRRSAAGAPARAAERPGAGLLVLGAATCLWLAGWWALGVAAAAAAVARGRRGRVLSRHAAPLLVGLAGAWVAVRPWPPPSNLATPLPQALCAVAVALAVAVVASDRRDAPPR